MLTKCFLPLVVFALLSCVDSSLPAPAPEPEPPNTLPKPGTPCTPQHAECTNQGYWVLNTADNSVVCVAEKRAPLPFEKCNNIDDDCDGATDEDWPELGTACSAMFRGCVISGVWVCDSYNDGVYCTADDTYEVNNKCESTW